MNILKHILLLVVILNLFQQLSIAQSYEPIILESGDTLITGVPLPAIGKTIQPDSVSQPKVVPYSPSDSIYNAHPNVHPIPENLTVID